MIPNFKGIPLIDRLAWAHENLEPVHTDYRILYEDPAFPDEAARVVISSGEWMASAMAGGILPPVEAYHRMTLELTTDLGEKIVCNYIEAQKHRLQNNICAEVVLDNPCDTEDPIGPMSEEEAIEYLLMKDVPERVWSSEYKYNRQMFRICKYNQLPKTRDYRNAWRLAA